MAFAFYITKLIKSAFLQTHKFICSQHKFLLFVKRKKMEVIVNMSNCSLTNKTSQKKSLMAVMVVFLTAAIWFTSIAATQRTITIVDGDATAVFKTTKNTVGEVLAQAGITLSYCDLLSTDLSTPVENASVVEITRAKEYTVLDGTNGTYTLLSPYTDVNQILAQHNVPLNPDDVVTLSGTTITLTRVVRSQEIINEPILFNTVYEDDSTILKGTEVVAQEGQNGNEDVVYHYIYTNGQYTGKERISSVVIKQPVDKIVKVGTKLGGSGNAPANYKKVITCRATAYDGSYETLGKHNPRTALGRVPTVGTVAVDPRVIPLGTKLYIETVDGSYVYGYSFAGDTGGSIKGNRVDLFMGSRREALNFGSRKVNVYVLE